MAINQQSYNVMFLSEQDLKDASVINENVDMKMLTPVIRMAQEIFLTKIIGTGLYVDLQDKIYNTAYSISGATRLSESDRFLLDAYITPVMVWLVMQQAPVFMTYKYMNKGVQTQNSDNSQPASDQEIQLLVNRAKNAADWYTQRLIYYLQANTSLFPAYMQSKSIDDVIPTSRGYKTSVFLGGNFFDGCLDCDWRRFYA